MQWDIGLEIGQTGVRLCTRERGETLVSPAWGASRKGETIALGDEALSMRGRTLKGVSVGRPVENGSVADPRLLGGWIVVLSAALVVLCGARGLLLPLAAGLAAARLYQICTKQFGGMSGDLSGYFLSLAELFMLAAINLGGI